MRVLFHRGHFDRNEISFQVIKYMKTLPKMKSYERKHLHMRLFPQNKNDWFLLNRLFSSDQAQNQT